MNDSINTFENFSNELLLEIFDYLSINDCFNAFYNLNSKLNSTLTLCNFSIDLTSISRQTYEEFYKKIIFPNYYRRIRKLQLSNDLTIHLLENFSHNYRLDDFKQLRSIKLIRPSYMTLGSFALMVPYLEPLEHISIESNSYPDDFLELVTMQSSSVRSCYLPGLEIQDELSFQSNIQYLTITVEDVTLLLNLLAVFSQLKYLHVSLRSTLDIDENNLPIVNIITCKNLDVLKLDILERSDIGFHEIEYIFLQTSFDNLKSFSYTSKTTYINHIDGHRWNQILSKYLLTIKEFQFFVQIPFSIDTYANMKTLFNRLQFNMHSSFPLSLSIDYFYYIIHTEIYPKHNFDLSFKLLSSDEFGNHDPIHDNITIKFSKVNSLILNNELISSCTNIPKTIKYLQIQGLKNDSNLDKCLEQCSHQLISLKIIGLPSDLPFMPKLQQLTIQTVMFKLNMVSKLSILCPRLELLTIEIDSIQEFREILDQLRYKSNLKQLKFIRVFSRDPNQTWTSWLGKSQPSAYMSNANYETKNAFLFIWL